DLVFTKSVLVAVPDLPAFLEKANRKLAPDGHALFLENGRGGLVAQLLRCIRHKRWDWRTAHYFTDPDMAVFRQAFDVQAVEKCRFPPVYLVHGTRRTSTRRTTRTTPDA
ncbi:MAG: hypothetical protein O3C21_08720, partial [Verrucomicrobia bacterium]|nr:hypothetical protein [Verrucomicrobiota bacterium]